MFLTFCVYSFHGNCTKYCMIRFANKGSLLCFTHCLSFSQFIFSIVKRKFCKRGFSVRLNMKVKCDLLHEKNNCDLLR